MSRAARQLEHAVVSLDDLEPYPGNPRRGDVATIKESLEVNGQVEPLVVNRRTMQVLAGNHRLLAVQELGWTHVDVVFVDVDEEAARRIVLALNRTSDLATYDSHELADLLSQCAALDGTGYDTSDLDALLDEVAEGMPLEDDDVPAAPAEARTEPADLYELGEHRLLCGDARDPDAYERLLGNAPGDVLVTDPPYGVSYEGKTRRALKIVNDTGAGLDGLLQAAFAACDAALGAGSPLYVFGPAGPQLASFLSAFVTPEWVLRQVLAWVKDALVLGRSDYHFRHESILYGFKRGPGRLGRGGERWYGGNRQTTVLECARPRAAREHPTMKPPELVAALLRNSSRRRDLVLDPFAGSGSTLVACEHLGRRARLLELDPAYCDVIVARYERLTGNTARRIET
jgi:DNA modification methylase